MKKLITVILILALLLPAAALAVDYHNEPFVGYWIGRMQGGYYGYDTVLRYVFITERGDTLHAAFGINMNAGSKDPECVTEIYRDKLIINDDGTLKVYTSKDTYILLQMSDDGHLFSIEPPIFFIKITLR